MDFQRITCYPFLINFQHKIRITDSNAIEKDETQDVTSTANKVSADDRLLWYRTMYIICQGSHYLTIVPSLVGDYFNIFCCMTK